MGENRDLHVDGSNSCQNLRFIKIVKHNRFLSFGCKQNPIENNANGTNITAASIILTFSFIIRIF